MSILCWTLRTKYLNINWLLLNVRMFDGIKKHCLMPILYLFLGTLIWDSDDIFVNPGCRLGLSSQHMSILFCSGVQGSTRDDEHDGDPVQSRSCLSLYGHYRQRRAETARDAVAKRQPLQTVVSMIAKPKTVQARSSEGVVDESAAEQQNNGKPTT